MGLYIHLVTMTEQGVKNIGNLKKIIAENRKIIESTGSKVVASYSTLGRYDLVAVLDIPNDTVAMELSAKIAAAGFFRPETLVAVSLKDFQAKVSK